MSGPIYKPHGMTGLSGTVTNGTGSGGSIANPTYAYDANGNMTLGAVRLISP